MKQFDKLHCKIKLRLQYEGRNLKDNVKVLDGMDLYLQVMWLMDEEDKYPGEFALSAADEQSKAEFSKAGIGWIASGDVVPNAALSG